MITLDDLRRIADAPLHTWLGTLLMSALAVLVAIAVHGLGARVVRRVARPYPVASAVVREINRPSRVVLAFLALEFLWLQVADTLPLAGALRTFAAVGLIVALTWLLVRVAAGVAEAIVQAHPLDTPDNLHARRIHTQTRVLARTVMVIIVIVMMFLF